MIKGAGGREREKVGREGRVSGGRDRKNEGVRWTKGYGKGRG